MEREAVHEQGNAVGDDHDASDCHSPAVDVSWTGMTPATSIAQRQATDHKNIDHEDDAVPHAKQRKKQVTAVAAQRDSNSSKSFPTPFKCSGDFCGFVLREQPPPVRHASIGAMTKSSSAAAMKRFGAGASATAASVQLALQMLFLPDEVALVTSDSLSNLVLVSASDRTGAIGPPKAADASELRVITYRSIALGKANREHLALRIRALERTDTHDLDVAVGKIESANSSTTSSAAVSSSTKAPRRSSLLDSTAAHEFRQGSRLRNCGDTGESVASYYRQVRVCSDCYAIYTLLDAVRKQLRSSAESGSASGNADTDSTSKPKRSGHRQSQQKLKDEWSSHVARELEAKERLYLRKSRPDGSGSSNSVDTAACVETDCAPLEAARSESDVALRTTMSMPLRDAMTDDRDSCAFPALLTPKSQSPSSRSLDTQLLAQSTSMPVLPGSGRTTTNSTIKDTSNGIRADRAAAGTTSCFAIVSNGSDATATKAAALAKSGVAFKGLDRYLRGESKHIDEPVLVEGQLFRHGALSTACAGTRANTPGGRKLQRPKTPATDVATVLLVDSDPTSLEQLHQGLRVIPALALEIESMLDPTEALAAAKAFAYDLILCERDFASSASRALMSGLDFVRLLRQFELAQSVAATRGSANASTAHRATVVCVTTQTSREDLQLYRDAGMDGCVGKPLRLDALQRTVQAALARITTGVHTSRSQPTSGSRSSSDAAVASATEALAHAKREQLERKRRRRQRLEASSALPFPGLVDMDARDDFVADTLHIDTETSLPFCVLGTATLEPPHVPNTFFNLVIVHDLFDTWERLQILLRPLVARYHGAVQVLLWNYPGQAYTTWRAGTLLNNVFHADCLDALLQHVGSRGRAIWRDTPYYLMGIGNGGSIATAFCAHTPPRDANTRALLLVNAFTHVDAALAQFLHDCIKVFAVTPTSRPDLPVYFHTRFLFSPAYLARVSTPLALNLFTAVMNPISLDGRRMLCQGALAHADVLTLQASTGGSDSNPSTARQLRVPLLSVCSAHNALVDANAHAQWLAQRCGLALVESIGKVLQQPTRRKQLSCILSLPGGHEVLQECKHDMLLLLEQLVTGYHETSSEATAGRKPLGAIRFAPFASNSAAVPTTSVVKSKLKTHDALRSTTHAVRDEDDDSNATHNRRLHGPAAMTTSSSSSKTVATGSFEDAFIDNVLTTVKQVTVAMPVSATFHSSSSGATNQVTTLSSSPERANWMQFQRERTQKASAAPSTTKPLGAVTRGPAKSIQLQQASSPSKLIAMTSWDPTTPAFERLSSNVIYKVGDGSKIYPDVLPSKSVSSSNANVPELKEYMAWRVKRNQKRLQRMATQARVIQRAFRAYYARTLLLRIRQSRCAVVLQRLWRAKVARKKYKGMQKHDWAARLVQRHWRGKLGRDSYRNRFRTYLGALAIQRIARGWLARRRVERIRTRRYSAAVAIQRRIRQFVARRKAFARRRRRNAALTLQRVFRGHVGRQRFAAERDKFLYAQTQSQGIAFGQQLLLEYKLYGTKLQSDVALLAQAKRDVEAQAEVLVREICEFDDGIRLLETEMHSLSQVETEALGGTTLGTGGLDEQAKWALREQKMRLDRSFTQMLAQIAQRKETLSALEEKLAQLDRERLSKEDELRSLERKLVVLLDEQQHELAQIKHKQQAREQLVLDFASGTSFDAGSTPKPFQNTTLGPHASPTWGAHNSNSAQSPQSIASSSSPLRSTAVAAANATSAYTQQQREEASALMESTETMMKFGFMSMSMTYFSSMNMVRAMRKIGAHHMTLDSAAAVSNKHWPEYNVNGAGSGSAASPIGFSISGGTNHGSPNPSSFEPAVPLGSFPGQQPLQVAGWSVADVARWLDTLALGQYKRAFADAAVDGALLLHLNDDDLKNTLGLEHRLHRKKVLTSVEQLRDTERNKMRKLYGAHQPSDSLPSPVGSISSSNGINSSTSNVAAAAVTPSRAVIPNSSGFSTNAAAAASLPTANSSASSTSNVVVPFPEFCTLVRHGKLKQLKEALANLPDRRFDPLTVRQAYASGVGTIYDDALETSAFHINKSDDHGNAPLLLAAQNNHLKVAQLLLAKGANPNHQNRAGNTAGHYAMAYSFFDLGAWLLDPEKGGGRDDVLNDNGLTAYDGLE